MDGLRIQRRLSDRPRMELARTVRVTKRFVRVVLKERARRFSGTSLVFDKKVRGTLNPFLVLRMRVFLGSRPVAARSARRDREKNSKLAVSCAREALRTYKKSNRCEDALVREIREEELEDVADLLTEVFSEEMGAKYRPYLHKQVKSYLKTRIESSPEVVCLVAVMYDVEKGKDQIVGTAEVSFSAATRSKYSLQPPDEYAYVCNLAVLENHRRKGCGGLLLSSCEDLALLFGKEELYVHVRLVDEPAKAMYRRRGYDVWKIEGPINILRSKRRALLRKVLKTQDR